MLFLDEIGDMPEEVQPMVLRVAERRGEYFRLGEEGRIRHSDIRLIGATHRPERLRSELKRCFQHELHTPSLNPQASSIWKECLMAGVFTIYCHGTGMSRDKKQDPSTCSAGATAPSLRCDSQAPSAGNERVLI